MSIVTKTGDGGTTALMYNRRVGKNHPRVEACGTVDELNAAVGLARAAVGNETSGDQLASIQKDLVVLMGELATASEDLPRYVNDGFKLVSAEMTAKLEQAVKELEAQDITTAGWATPGANIAAATMDFARTVCRRAERRVCALLDGGELKNTEMNVYLNRLSDLLWLMARREEPELE